MFDRYKKTFGNLTLRYIYIPLHNKIELLKNLLHYRIKKSVSVFAILLLSNFIAISQTTIQDSLNRIVNSHLHDTIIIDQINEYSFQNSFNNPHITIPYSDIAIERSKALNDSNRLSRSFNRKAVAYYFLGDYSNALEYYFNSLEINERLNNTEFTATDYNNIGLVLIEEQLFDEALSYFEKSLSLLDSISQKDKYARVLDNIGIAHYSMKNFEEALIWFRKSLKINREIDQKQTIASNIKNVGFVFLLQENYSLALSHFKLALDIYKDLKLNNEIFNLLNNSAFVCIKLHKPSEAFNFIAEAKKLAPEVNSVKLSLDLMKVEADFFSSIKDYKKSISLYNQYIDLKDSLQLSDKKKNFEQLKLLSETNKKVKNLDLLRALNKSQEEKIKDQKKIQIGIIILLALSLVIIYLIFSALKAKSQLNKKLESLVKKRTSELLQAKEKAEYSDKMKTSFLQNISHEVRTPMNAIVGFTNLLLQNDYEEFERDELLKNISNGTIKLLNLFEKISYLSLIENQSIKPVYSNCYIDEIFSNLQMKFYKQILDKNLPLSIKYIIDENIKDIRLNLPKSIIEITLNELIENAIKFSDHGHIIFGASLNHDDLNIYVIDSGIGIPTQNINKVFDKFVKFDNGNNHSNHGAGVGLFIAQKNLELVNSKIIAESKVGKGTTMRFSITLNNND